MRGRRMGRPGLVGMAARTAVVAGTATAVSGNVSRRQQSKADAQAAEQQQAQAQYAPPPQEYAQAAPPAQPEESTEDLIAQLKKLGDLKEAGVLDEAEFQTAKAKLLAQM
jgi:hypothetical protein